MPLKRTFIFADEQVTCKNCQYNYPMPCDQPGKKHGKYCQEFCRPTPNSDEDCMLLGRDCLQWFPREISRSSAKSEHDGKRKPRWYEKYDDV